jgi:monolysocardiolipin acyltransferase
LDDPLLFGLLNSFDPENVRWTLGAHNICFTNPIYSWFFHTGQTLPIVRGAGIYQEGMETAIKLLKQGKWVHIFPQGKVCTPDAVLKFRWGIARLIMEANPLVLPFYHRG